MSGCKCVPGRRQQVEADRITRLTRAVEEGIFHLFAQAIVPSGAAGSNPPPVRDPAALAGRAWWPGNPRRVPPVCGALPPDTGDRPLGRAADGRPSGRVASGPPGVASCPSARSISVSSSLDDQDLVPALREYLTEHGLPPEALCFEIAEAAALGNFAQLVAPHFRDPGGGLRSRAGRLRQRAGLVRPPQGAAGRLRQDRRPLRAERGRGPRVRHPCEGRQPDRSDHGHHDDRRGGRERDHSATAASSWGGIRAGVCRGAAGAAG